MASRAGVRHPGLAADRDPVVTLTVIAGVAAGAAAGYVGGALDIVVMRVVDIFLAFPGILLAIALAGVLGPNLGNLVIALSVMGPVGTPGWCAPRS